MQEDVARRKEVKEEGAGIESGNSSTNGVRL
jgi:hypothetical protein